MSRKLTLEDFIERSIKIHNNKYDYSKSIYINCDTKLIIICPIHGEFQQIPYTHLHGGGCWLCRTIKIKETNLCSTQEFINKAKKLHGNVYDYSIVNYLGSKKKVDIICKKHGIFVISPDHHINNKYGCPKCLTDKTNRIYKLNKNDFIYRANLKHHSFYNYDLVEYIKSRDKIKIICPLHGMFIQSANAHLCGNRCDKCSNVNISLKERIWLKLNNIDDDINHRQVLIKMNNKKYKVDGYIPETKTVFEFLGDYYHGNPAIYLETDINHKCKKSFALLYNNTIKKFNDLLESGYKVYYVWENNFNINNSSITEWKFNNFL